MTLMTPIIKWKKDPPKPLEECLESWKYERRAIFSYKDATEKDLASEDFVLWIRSSFYRVRKYLNKVARNLQEQGLTEESNHVRLINNLIHSCNPDLVKGGNRPTPVNLPESILEYRVSVLLKEIGCQSNPDKQGVFPIILEDKLFDKDLQIMLSKLALSLPFLYSSMNFYVHNSYWTIFVYPIMNKNGEKKFEQVQEELSKVQRIAGSGKKEEFIYAVRKLPLDMVARWHRMRTSSNQDNEILFQVLKRNPRVEPWAWHIAQGLWQICDIVEKEESETKVQQKLDDATNWIETLSKIASRNKYPQQKFDYKEIYRQQQRLIAY